ncbi:Peptidyl-prolyl cis-trans isomerase FKBP16-4, chloroplastic [Zostera marina]|uniref:peptidylprolyl isomerase n=1 Tax=Zostera marina TaxID=29655 RepID=A0A0K9PNM4_ZOSMR|nr:Peptidyl-prolyl cis-trans isomerase FKBP16-4, chloroplastic [Zostera marina]
MELSLPRLLQISDHRHLLLQQKPSIAGSGKYSGSRSSSSLYVRCSSGSSLPSVPSSQSSERDTGAVIDRRLVLGSIISTATTIYLSDGAAEAVSTSKRALRASKIPQSEFTDLPNGLKYYDVKVGSGAEAMKASRVAVHYVARWKGITFMTSRQGLGVGGGTPYGFDVGQSEKGSVLKGLDLGVLGMKVGGQRLLIVPPELAYGSKGVQEIPPNATIELDVELLSIKQSPFGTSVKIIEG